VDSQVPRRWIGPALIALGAAIVIPVLVLTQAPNEGSLPSAIAQLSPTTETPPAEVGDLLQPGSSVVLPVRSSQGVSGSITVERGEDVGGYRLVPDPSSDDHFFIEVMATYELDVAPETASWGQLDWRVEGENGPVDAEPLEAFPQPDGRNYLGNWPGATVPEPRYVGWMIFTVPRDAAEVALELIYQPPGLSEATRIPVRLAADPPEPVAADWPRPQPAYVDQAGLPFPVLDNAEADALFVDPDECTNPDGGYTVRYPDSWYTNTEIGGVPACSWFSPTFYLATEDGARPDEIAIEIRVFEGAIGFIWADLYSESVTLDGVSGRRYETGMTVDAGIPSDMFQYSYLAYLDAEPSEGRKLWAFTGTEFGGDYELNRAVFDRIMASLEFTD
jgi:hypothetical protein